MLSQTPLVIKSALLGTGLFCLEESGGVSGAHKSTKFLRYLLGLRETWMLYMYFIT